VTAVGSRQYVARLLQTPQEFSAVVFSGQRAKVLLYPGFWFFIGIGAQFQRRQLPLAK
jgi:hypothetical protein